MAISTPQFNQTDPFSEEPKVEPFEEGEAEPEEWKSRKIGLDLTMGVSSFGNMTFGPGLELNARDFKQYLSPVYGFNLSLNTLVKEEGRQTRVRFFPTADAYAGVRFKTGDHTAVGATIGYGAGGIINEGGVFFSSTGLFFEFKRLTCQGLAIFPMVQNLGLENFAIGFKMAFHF